MKRGNTFRRESRKELEKNSTIVLHVVCRVVSRKVAFDQYFRMTKLKLIGVFCYFQRCTFLGRFIVSKLSFCGNVVELKLNEESFLLLAPNY